MNKHHVIIELNPSICVVKDFETDIPDVVITKGYDSEGNEVDYDKFAVDAYINANAYKEQRAQAYPSIAEQLDMQYWDKLNGTTTWADAIAATKAKYPKE